MGRLDEPVQLGEAIEMEGGRVESREEGRVGLEVVGGVDPLEPRELEPSEKEQVD